MYGRMKISIFHRALQTSLNVDRDTFNCGASHTSTRVVGLGPEMFLDTTPLPKPNVTAFFSSDLS